MKKMKRRILALLLAFVMLFTLGPSNLAVAEGENTNFTVTSIDVNVKPYGTDTFVPLTDDMTGLHNNDEVQIIVNWAVSNAAVGGGEQTFTYALSPIVGIALSNRNGVVTHDDDGSKTTVGSWVIEDGNLKITLFDEFLEKGNIKGDTKINGIINVENTNNQETVDTTITVVDKEFGVEIDMDKLPSEVTVDKATAGSPTLDTDGNLLVPYTIAATALYGDVTGVVVTDTWGTSFVLDGSVSVSSTGSASPSVTTNANSFETTSFDMEAGEVVTFSYTLKIPADGVDEVLKNRYYTTIEDNQVQVDYTGDDGEDGTVTDQVNSIDFNEPSISKAGNYNTNGTDTTDDDTVSWTITINGNNSNLTDWTFVDDASENLGAATSITYTGTVDGQSVSGTLGSLDEVSGLFADSIVQNLTITYTTPVTDASSTTILSGPKYTNNVTITSDDDPTYSKTSGDKTVVGPVEDYTLIDKTHSNPDEENMEIQWTTYLTIPAGAKLTDYIYSDNISNTHGLKAGSITVTGATAGEITGDTDGSMYFTIKFANDQVDNSAGLTDKVITITYTTTYDSSLMWGTTKQFDNTGIVTYKEDGQQGEQRDTDSVTVEFDIVSMLSKNSVDYVQKDKIQWKLDVAMYDYNVDSYPADTELVITDTLDSRLSYVDGSMKINNGTTLVDADASSQGFAVSYNESTNEITITTTWADFVACWAGEYTKVFNITYLSEIKDLQGFIDGGQQVTFTNKAEGTVGTDNLNTVTATKSITPSELLDKTSVYNEDTAPYIVYTVEVNNGAYDLASGDTITLKDTLSNTANFVGNAGVTVYQHNGSSFEKLDSSAYSVSIGSNTITLTVPDSSYLKIEYQVLPSADVGEQFTVSNSVQLICDNVDGTQVENQITDTATESSSSADHTEAILKVYKHYNNQPLSGAVFSLYKMTSDGAGGYTETHADDLTTDATGYGVSDAVINFDVIYKLVEKTAPTDYQKDETPFYFIIQGQDAATFPADFATNYPGTHKIYATTEVADGTITQEIVNTPVDTHSVAVAKTDEAGVALGGVTLELYQDSKDAGNLVATWDTTSTPTKQWVVGTDDGELAPGTYVLSEKIAPKGYAYAEDITFTLNADGTITGNTGGTITTATNLVTLTMEDPALDDIVISKRIAATTTELAGATLAVYKDSVANGEKIAEWTSGSVYTLDGSKLEAGATYVLTETAVPAGYKKADDITFTIDEDGNIQTTAANDANADIIMYDEPTKTLAIDKVDENGDSLAGARLVLYETFKIDTNIVDEWESGNAPKTFVIGDGAGELSAGTYILCETSSPAGYKLADDITFTIAADGSVTSTTNGAVSTSGNVITVSMEDEPIDDIVISKRITGTDTELAGAVLGIYKYSVSDANLVEQWTSNGTPHTIDGKKLVAGAIYILHEISAPAGYKKAVDIEFTLNYVGEITSIGGGTSDANADVIMYDAPVKTLAIEKVDESDAALTGATLTLYKDSVAESNKVDSWTSGAEAKTFTIGTGSGELATGDYILVETAAPKGYVISANVTFTVNNDGSATITGAAGAVSTNGNVVTVTMTDEAIDDITIDKIDSETDAGVSGAVLGIYKGSVADTNLVEQWTSNGTPHTIDGSKLEVGATYILHEITAPEGYERTDDITFTIDENGDVQTTATGATADVVMEDDPIHYVAFDKQNGEGTRLTDAVLELYDSLGNLKGSWTTTQVKTFKVGDSFGELAPGEYTLKEKTAPKGYAYADDITFTVNADGTITGTTAVTNGNTVTITMVDPEIADLFVKKVAEGEITDLPGATLGLYEGATLLDSWPTSSTYQLDVSELKVGVTYTIKELTAPTGYQLASDITFVINDDGTLGTVTGGTAGNHNGSIEFNLITMEDVAIPQNAKKVSFMKTDENGAALTGATLTLYKDSVAESNKVDYWTTTDEARLYVVGTEAGQLEPGDYILVETAAPTGYACAENITFTIEDDGTVSNCASAVVDGTDPDLVVITMEDEPLADLYVVKRETGESTGLPGAEMALYESPDGSLSRMTCIDSWTSTADPHKILGSELKANQYYVILEDTAPAGYEVADPIVFRVNASGAIVDCTGTTEMYNGSAVINMIVMYDAKIVEKKIAFTKQNASGATLTGAELVINTAGGAVFDTWITSATPQEYVIGDEAGQMAPGTYTLSENVAPQGYGYAEEVKFTVAADGTVTIVSGDGTATVAGDLTTIVMEDPAIPNLYISKREAGKTVELDGATLALYKDSVAAVNKIDEWSTGTVHEIAGSLLEANATYIIKEISAPEGYEVADNITFTLDAEGKIKSCTGETDEYDGSAVINMVIMYDELEATTTEEDTTEEDTTEEDTTEEDTTEEDTTEEDTTEEDTTEEDTTEEDTTEEDTTEEDTTEEDTTEEDTTEEDTTEEDTTEEDTTEEDTTEEDTTEEDTTEEDTTEEEDDDDSPKTGDEAPIAPVAGVAALCMVGVLLLKRRKREF